MAALPLIVFDVNETLLGLAGCRRLRFLGKQLRIGWRGGRMDWARILAFLTGTVDQELLAIRNEPGNLCLRETAWWGWERCHKMHKSMSCLKVRPPKVILNANCYFPPWSHCSSFRPLIPSDFSLPFESAENRRGAQQQKVGWETGST